MSKFAVIFFFKISKTRTNLEYGNPITVAMIPDSLKVGGFQYPVKHLSRNLVSHMLSV